MKQFRYNLQTVLNYKNQVLDDLKIQHAAAADLVNRKQEKIQNMEGQLSEFQHGFDSTMQQGAPIETLRLYEACIDGARTRIAGEKEPLWKSNKLFLCIFHTAIIMRIDNHNRNSYTVKFIWPWSEA